MDLDDREAVTFGECFDLCIRHTVQVLVFPPFCDAADSAPQAQLRPATAKMVVQYQDSVVGKQVHEFSHDFVSERGFRVGKESKSRDQLKSTHGEDGLSGQIGLKELSFLKMAFRHGE